MLSRGALKRNLRALRAELYRNDDGTQSPRHPDRAPKYYKNEHKQLTRSKRPWEK